MILALTAFCAAMAALTGLGIWHTIRSGSPASDADWLDPHATWLPGGHLDDLDVHERFDAIVAAEWPKAGAQ